jgi:isoleucyl-tRNA synthetase
LAPIIPHTAEELWDYGPARADKLASVHLAEFPEAEPRWDDAERIERWNELLALREKVLVALEGLRKTKQIGSAQEARVRITTNQSERWMSERELIATVCIVSEVEIVPDSVAVTEQVEADRSPYAKCERCWNYRPTVGQSSLYSTLCDRCERVMQGLRPEG